MPREAPRPDRAPSPAPFTGVRLSDPRYEREGLRFLSLESPAIGGRGDVTVFVPPQADGASDLPLVLLLHGAYGSHWAWAFRGGAHRIAAGLIERGEIAPMVLVMPADGYWGASSGYFTQSWADYEAWVLDAVVGCVTAHVPPLGAGSPIFVAGLSMGGFGALRLGARHGARVRGVSAHSSVCHLDQLRIFAERGSRLPAPPAPEDADVLWSLRGRPGALPPLRFDCGRGDPLIEPNRALHRALEADGIAHAFHEHDGGHDWDYWSARLPDTLRFFDGIARRPTAGDPALPRPT